MSSNCLSRGLVFWSFQSTTSRDSECVVTCAYPMSLGLTKQQSWNWLVRWVVGMMSTRMFWRISLRSILLGWLCNLFDGPRWRCCWWNCYGTLQSVEGWKDAFRWSLVKRWLDHRKIRRVWRAWSVKKKEILKNAHESVWFRIVWCISYNNLFVQWLQGIGSIAKSSILDKGIRLKYKLCCRSHLFCIRFVFPSELSKSQSDVP